MERKILYQSVAEDLKKKILNSTYAVGDFLPTEIELEKIYDVSKITVRNAIKMLVSEGYVTKQSGKGTTVISNRLFNRLSKAESFSSILENNGNDVKKKIVSIKEISIDECPTKFELNQLTGCITEVTKVYELNSKPFIIFKHYLPFRLNEESREDLNNVSLYQVIKEMGEMVNRFDDDFYGCLLDEDQQKSLETTDKVGIKRIRKSYDQVDNLVEYAEAIYLTNKFPYKIKYEI
ncbi:GntR family transcriptional regulator [Companilactobacillus insicii]|uniref:GntR family transcriptional regulator n=1 Tax=Companilactobacillus insicii TaxID=1732567 RepID=UPI0013DE6730|nr:GntR family transcriptional regulator [Companilactobacillus insicii]